MDIDEKLLSQNEAEKAGEFRASKRGETIQASTSIRESVQQKKMQESKDSKDNDSGDLLSGAGISPILKSTDEALKFAWENLITSFGLTLIWIDIHVFLNKVFGPTVFRDPGEEWVPDNIKKMVGKSKQASSLLRIVEGAGIGCLNLGCLFVILFVLSLIALIVSGLSSPMIIIKGLFGSLWSWLTGGK